MKTKGLEMVMKQDLEILVNQVLAMKNNTDSRHCSVIPASSILRSHQRPHLGSIPSSNKL